jgi:hypothetical protein
MRKEGEGAGELHLRRCNKRILARGSTAGARLEVSSSFPSPQASAELPHHLRSHGLLPWARLVTGERGVAGGTTPPIYSYFRVEV